MFWKKTKQGAGSKTMVEILPGPVPIEELIAQHMVQDLKKDPGKVARFSSVVRQRESDKPRFDFRVFDADEAAGKGLEVENYNSFEGHLELVIYHGWFDKSTREVHFRP
ncbi:MAG: hypothetical protein WC369_10560 [Dehalococcoidales bacterium]|jgi:hypothetical protein